MIVVGDAEKEYVLANKRKTQDMASHFQDCSYYCQVPVYSQ
jgi:hypothetical protein